MQLITLTETTQMSFGAFTVGPLGGTINNAGNTTGDVVAIPNVVEDFFKTTSILHMILKMK